MNEHRQNDRDILRYTDVEYTPEGYENVYRWDDFLEIAGGDARYAAMLINRTVAGEPEEGLHPETLVDQDIRDGVAFMLAGRPIVPEDVYDLPRTVHGLYSELVDNVGRSGTLLRDWRGFSAGADADDVLRALEGAFGETEDSRAGTVLGAYAEDTFMSPIYAAEDAARDVTPLTPWEDEDGVAFLSRTLDADAGAVVPCLWYCRRDEGQGSRSAASSSTVRKSVSTRSPPRRPPTASTAFSPISRIPPAAWSRCATSPCAAPMAGRPMRSSTSATRVRPWPCSARSRDAGSRPTAPTPSSIALRSAALRRRSSPRGHSR